MASNRMALAFWLMAVSAAAYCTVLVEIVLGFPLSPVSAYLSEYSAVDQPTRAVFATCDSAAVIVGIAGVVLALTELSGNNRREVFSLLAIGIGWVATTLDIFFPMGCAESLEYCNPPQAVTVHVVTSSIIALAHLMAVVVLWPRFKVLTICYAVVCAEVSILALTGTPVGIPQRIQVIFESIIIIAVGWFCWQPKTKVQLR